MFEPLAVPAINRLLRANAWALEKLTAHAGKTAVLACAPFEVRLTVLATGEVAAAARETAPDVTITVTPGSLLRLAARDESAWNAARVSGDVQFAAAIDYVRRNLEWDYEEDLSRVFGDIAAHRIAGAVREIDRWGRAAALNLGQSFAEYAMYEQPLLASRRAVEEFNREVDEVRDHAARLEKRIELLCRRLSGAP
jgi:ubiquinone biosynthesis protein UbiJ